MEIKSKGETANTELETNNGEECLEHHFLGKEANYIGEGARDIVGINSHKLTAE